MATKVKQLNGIEALQQFLRENPSLFNMSELERQSKLPSGSLRHISAGSRDLNRYQYKNVRDIMCPKLCELVFILQNNKDSYF